jgi:hypothetical protein
MHGNSNIKCLLLLFILEAQRGYRTRKQHELADTLFEILKGCRTLSTLDWN